MKNIAILLFLTLILAFNSCDKGLEDLNIDPNRPSQIYPGELLNQMQYRYTNLIMQGARSFTHQLMQVDVPRVSRSEGIHRYYISPRGWDSFYLIYADAIDLYDISLRLNAPAYQAIALIYKSWSFSIVTDLYGDIPFSEAGKISEGILQPKFDEQKLIYQTILSDLEMANTLLASTSTFAYGGDIVYGTTGAAGILKWRKFANSMRLRLLLRLMKRDGEINVVQQINSILSDPQKYPVFVSNADEAILNYPGTFPFFNPYYNQRQLEWRDGTYFSEYFIESLKDVNDPRLSVWVRTIRVDGKDIYRGIPSGYNFDVEYNVGDNSSYRDELKTIPHLGIMMTFAELQFIKAELAIRGFSTGETAMEHYNKGISASMTQWKVQVPSGFLTHEKVVFPVDGTFEEKLEKIIQQKYFAFTFNDYQAWFEKRRTGYPVLPRGPGVPAENAFPRRVPYPTYLQSMNPQNLKIAADRIGGDTSDTRVWWDVE